MPTDAPAPLSDDQVRTFHDEGYLVVEDVLRDADLQPVIDEITEAIDQRARPLVESGELPTTYAKEDFEHRLTRISQHTDKVAVSMWNGVLCGPAFFNLIRHRALLDLAEQLCGPELIASSVYRLRPKIPGHIMGPVPWHQDSGYFEPYCDDALVLTMWLPLVDATQENGCMWVMPRVHRQGILTHAQRQRKPYLFIHDPSLPSDERAVCCPVKKGGILLLTNMTPHASFENHTDVVRWSMDLRYQSAKLPTNATITRLPDDDVPSAAAGVPVACYPPEADFLVRSRVRPEEVVTDPAQFERLRSGHQNPGMTRRWETIEG